MLPSFKPETYQDVKKTLMWYTTVLLSVISLLFYFLLLSSDQRDFINSLMRNITPNPFIGPGIFLTFSTFIAWWMISIFEIHDKVYDKYFVKWRYWYYVDFIFPRLFKPFITNLPQRFFEVASENVNEYKKIFYHFAGDGATKINTNLKVRFYEKITKYWITQINEIFLFLSFIAIVILKNTLSIRYNVTFNALVIISILFIINRIFVKATRISVRDATNDEIEDIHKNHLSELEEQIKSTCQKFGLRYGSEKN